SLNELGRMLDRTQPEEARQVLEKAIRFERDALKAKPQEAAYRETLCQSLWSLVQTHRRLNALGETARTAAELVQEAPAGWPEADKAALFLARCLRDVGKDEKLTTAERQKLTQQLGDLALELLRKAVQGGYKDVTVLKNSPDLEPLRSRPDFQKLV